MIVLADSSPLITLARARHFELLREFYGKLIVSREVYDEVAGGADLPGAKEVRTASWIRVDSVSTEPVPEIKLACAGLGAGERTIVYLACGLKADLVLIDEVKARRAAKTARLNVAGSIAVLERGARLGLVGNLRSVYQSLLEQGIRYDERLLNRSLERLRTAGRIP